MPTFSVGSNSESAFGWPSSSYLWIQMEPDVGLFSPARSCGREEDIKPKVAKTTTQRRSVKTMYDNELVKRQ